MDVTTSARSPIYTTAARVLHWTTALLLIPLFGLGLSMTHVLEDGDFKLRVYSWHEWTGVTVFGLTAARLLWRLRHRPPPIALPAAERMARGFVHGAIYVVLIAQPITGWMMNSAFGFSLVYLGLVTVPDLVSENRDLALRLQWWHETLAIALFLLFLAHMGGVLTNHFVKRKDILGRMWRSSN
jgi:cytochrome b561